MVTCGGQATIPMVAAVSPRGQGALRARSWPVISSKSAGPGTRANIDEFTETTSRRIESGRRRRQGQGHHRPQPGRAAADHARHGLHAERRRRPRRRSRPRSRRWSPSVQALRAGLSAEAEGAVRSLSRGPSNIPGVGPRHGLKTTVFLEVEGAGALPAGLRRQPGHHDQRRAAHRANAWPTQRMAAAMAAPAEEPTHEPARKLYISDVTLRDGSHADPPPVQRRAGAARSPRRSTRPASTPSRSRTATACRVGSFNYGFGAHTDVEWIEAVAERRQAREDRHAAAARHRHRRTTCRPPTTPAPASCASPRTAPRPTSRGSTSSTRASWAWTRSAS